MAGGDALTPRKCAGCDELFKPHPRERNPRLWCSPNCRGRTIPRKRKPSKDYLAVRHNVCEVCAARWISSTAGRPARACTSKACRRVLHASDERESYAKDPGGVKGRVRARRSERNEKQIQRDRDTRRRWVAQAGYYESKQASDELRRARKAGAEVEAFRRSDIFVRDRWTCGICKQSIDPQRRWPDPMSQSLDHILPLSLGGGHSPANVRSAHLVCNIRRGNRVTPEELEALASCR